MNYKRIYDQLISKWKHKEKMPEGYYVSKICLGFSVIGPDETKYRSLKECARKTHHEPRTIKHWIENNPEKGFKFDK